MRDLEKFSELLDGIVVNLKDANQEAELGNGSLYITLQWKFNKELLSKYKQWVSDNHRTENVSTLREFIDRESEFLRRNQVRHVKCAMGNMEFGLVRALKE